MLTKGAIGNLINRYKAVLKKCHLMNTFGSLAVASMLVLGGAGEAGAQYIEGYGSAITVEQSQITVDGLSDKARILGGWYINSAPTDAQKAELNSSITVNGGILNDAEGWTKTQTGFIFGGHYVSDLSTGTDKTVHEFNTGTTNVVINATDPVQSEYVIGGTGMHNSNVKLTGTETNVTINGGVFGKERPDGNVPEMYIAGGDNLKQGGYGAYVTSATSSIGETNITINDGKFNAAIIGGSNVIEYYRASAGEMSAEVGTANININGGEFNHAIVGGGLTWGGGDSETPKNPNYAGVKSEVGKVVMNIDGSSGKLNVNGDIYAGGMQGKAGENDKWNYAWNSNTVGEAKIVISNAEVKNVYGSNARLKDLPTSDSNKVTWEYSPVADKAVKTDLTLADSTAETVVLSHADSTLTAAGKTSVDELVFAGTDITIADTEKNKADVTLGSSVDASLKNINITMTEGQKLTLNSTATIVGNVTGLFSGDSSITGRGDIVANHLEGNYGTIVGQDSNVTLQGDSITLTGKGIYPVVYNAGSTGWTHEFNANADLDTDNLKQNDITIIGQSGSQAVNAQSNGITIRNFDTLTLKNEGDAADDAYAISSTGSGVITIKEGKTVDIASTGRGALYNTAAMSIDADEVSISAVIGKQSEARKQSAVYATSGTLDVTAKDKLTIKAEGASADAKFYAMGVTGGTVTLKGGANSSITGDIALTGGTTTIEMGKGSTSTAAFRSLPAHLPPSRATSPLLTRTTPATTPSLSSRTRAL